MVMSVAVVQEASGLDPAENRERLAALTPDDADLVVSRRPSPATSARPARMSPGVAEAIDGPFASALELVAAERRTTVVAGMFETSDDPARPFNTLVVRGRARRATARSISTTRSATGSRIG